MALELLSGNQAVTEAVRLARTQVVAAYPITPQTTIIEAIADHIAAGRMDCDYITVESEHSAMAAVIGASLGGVRTFTASSSQGLALMHELLHWAGGSRLPIVMANVNRALGPPWNIWSDHTDSMAQRDTGWMQVYAETNQEALDMTLQAFRVAEDPRVQLPAMVMLDAFVLSHTYMPVDVPAQGVADAFLPAFRPGQAIEPRERAVFGTFSPPNLCYMELRHDIHAAMEAAGAVWAEVEQEYAKATGRPALGPLEEYRTEGADAVLLASGSLAATAREAVDRLRDEGLKVGLVRLRFFRPFPRRELQELASRFRAIGVVDRAYSFGGGGPVALEVRSALAGLADGPRLASFVAGLGGRDVRPDHLADLLRRLHAGDVPAEEWVGLRPEVAG